MTPADIAWLIRLVRDVASAEIMPRFQNLSAADIQTKTGPLDQVTVADEAAEARLAAALRERYPGAVIVGEEAASRDPAILGSIDAAELCFILDPIDGTANFIAGMPLFGVMLAATSRGRTVASIIHDPVGGETAWALAGEGAWMEGEGGQRRRLRVADPAPVHAMYGAASWRFMPEPQRSTFCARLPRVAAASDYRCAAHQYRTLAAGHLQFVVFSRLLPWDHAAGVLLHEEAGGYAARLDGSPYTASTFDGGLICAPDEPSWAALRQALFGGGE